MVLEQFDIYMQKNEPWPLPQEIHKNKFEKYFELHCVVAPLKVMLKSYPQYQDVTLFWNRVIADVIR